MQTLDPLVDNKKWQMLSTNLLIIPRMLVLFCGLTSQSTVMVMSRRSVNLTTLFLTSLDLSVVHLLSPVTVNVNGSRQVAVSQETARNHLWEAGMLTKADMSQVEQQPLLHQVVPVCNSAIRYSMQISRVKGHWMHFPYFSWLQKIVNESLFSCTVYIFAMYPVLQKAFPRTP